MPALLNTEDCAKALLALAEDLEGLDRGAQVQDALQRIAATTACHAAVKANYPLTYEKMAHILDELRATAYSTICPHGRPVMLRLTRREIEKNFDRHMKSPTLYYIGRLAQLIGMFELLVDIMTAGPLGPSPGCSPSASSFFLQDGRLPA